MARRKRRGNSARRASAVPIFLLFLRDAPLPRDFREDSRDASSAQMSVIARVVLREAKERQAPRITLAS